MKKTHEQHNHDHTSCGCGHHHEHISCECGHAHHHEHHVHKEFSEISVSVILFIAGILFQTRWLVASFTAFFVAYILLGGKILKSAGKNILKGHVFDENFLMSVATLAAFAIGDFPEAVGVMLFFRIGELFEDIAVEKSRGKIMEVVDLRPETVQVVHEYGVHVVPAAEVEIGEILLVRAGERIPLDGVVTQGESRIDTAPVTGEPVPVKVMEGDEVISGCLNTSGVLKIQVKRKLADSMVSRILNSVEHAAANKPRINRFITRFARVYTPFVVILALLTAVIPSIFTGEWSKWIYTAVSFLVISCPCALVISVPLAFFAGIGMGAKKGILFKSGLAIEVLNQVKAVVLDKTGTLTEGVFKVQKCVSVGEQSEDGVLFLAATCEIQSTHPIADSIVKEAKSRGLHLESPKSTEEIAGKGIHALTDKGEILCGNRALMESFGVDLTRLETGIGGTEVLVACSGELIGWILISDSPKADSKETITRLKTKGIKTVMLTGDSQESAEVIADDLGVEELYAKLLPEEKLDRFYQVRKRMGKVLFVGDGINDAPVLAGADVGAAMGNGTDAAVEAADIVFMTSSTKAVVEAMDIAKRTNRIAIQNVIFALGIKVMVMVLGLCGFANMWLAVFADTGVAMLCVLNSVRILRRK